MLFSLRFQRATFSGLLFAVLVVTQLHSSPATAADNWLQVNSNGFLESDYRSDEGTRLHEFNEQLYASNSDGLFLLNNPSIKNWIKTSLPNSPTGPGNNARLIGVVGDYFYAESGGDLWWIKDGSALGSSDWKKVASSPSNIVLTPLAEFDGALYAQVMVTNTGPFEVWRTTNIGSTSMSWSKVVQNSFGDPANNQWISMAQVYDGDLYIGTSTLNGTFGYPGDYGDGVEVWKTGTGNLGDWVQVNVDGFGTLFDGCLNTDCNFPIHQVIGSSAVYASRWDGAERLYVGTKSHFGAEIWSYNGSSWSNETPRWAGPCLIGCGPGRNESMKVYRDHLYLAEGFPTANLAKFDGRNWYIEEDGPHPFDPDNARLWDQAVHEGHLYVTTHTSALTAENHGDQVWGFFPPERYVSVALGKDAGDCTDSAHPCKSIQYGLDQSTNGELIKLAQGDYAGKNVINSRKMDVTLQGGWNESFSSRTDDPAGTRIVGIGFGSLLSIMGSGKDIQLRLSGLVLQAGVVDTIGGGGGIYALGDNGHVTLEVERTILVENHAPVGGGLFLEARNNGSLLLQMERSAVRQNRSDSAGAGIYTWTHTGGVSRLNISNSFLTDNSASVNGGGLAGYVSNTGRGEFMLTHNTFSANWANSRGGGLYLEAMDGGTILSGLTGDIVWGNTAGSDDHSDDLYLTRIGSGSSLSSFGEYSDIGILSDLQGLYDDRAGNISIDPLFLIPENSNYFLSPSSPLIDSAACGVLVPAGVGIGDFKCVRKAPYVDYSGDERPLACAIQCDIGADEYVPADTWDCELKDVYINTGDVSGHQSCLAANLIEISTIKVLASGNLTLSAIKDKNISGHILLGPSFRVNGGGQLKAGILACTSTQTYVAGRGCVNVP